MKLTKILAIDDQIDNLIVLKALIDEAFPGVDYLYAQSGKEGIEICLTEKPDVILLDIVMPGMDGYEVCQWIKSNDKTRMIPVVFITAARTDKDSRIKALEYGADAFLTKPVDESELTAQIKSMLRIKEAEDLKMDEKERLIRLVEERTGELKKELVQRKKTEEKLAVSEDRFRSIFANMVSGCCFNEIIYEDGIACDYRIIDINPAYEKICELTRDKVVGHLASHVYQTKSIPFFDIYNRVVISGIPETYEAFFEPAQKYLQITTICPAPGKFSNIFDDITDRLHAEEALKTNEARLQLITDSSTDVICSYDLQSRFTSANKALCQLLGLPAYEIIGKTHQELGFPESNCIEWAELHRQVVEKQLPVNSVSATPVGDNTIHFFDVSLYPLYDAINGIIGIGATIRDITEQKKAKKALEESESQFREFFEKAADAIFIADIETGIITDVNIAATQLMKRPVHELIGIHQSQLHPSSNEKYTKDTFQEHKKSAEQNEVNKAIENYVIDADGKLIPVEILASEVIIKGKPHLLGTFRDISERKNAEKERIEMYQFQQSLLKTIPYGMDIVDESGNVLFHNDLLENVFAKEAIGRKCYHLYRDDKSQCFDCPLFKGIEIGKTEVYTATNVLGGRTFEISHTGMIYKGKKAMLEIFKDITEQVEATQRITLLANALENINECISITDVNDIILYINRSMLQTYQYEEHELIGQHVRILRPVEQKFEHARDILEQTKEGGWKGQLINRRKDGTWFPISLSSATVVDSEGKIIALIGVAVDITESLQKHEELQKAQRLAEENEKRYRQFISQVSEGVYRFEATDPIDINLPLEEQVDLIYDRMLFAECNKAFLGMYELSQESDVLGRGHLDFHGGRHNEINRNSLRRFIENGYRIENAVTEELTSLGKRVYLSNNTVGIVDNNHLIRMWGTQSDITFKLRAEKEQTVIHEISMLALTASNIEALTGVIRKGLSPVIDTSNMHLALLDEKTEMLNEIKYLDDSPVKLTCSVEKSATGYVIKNKCSLLVNSAGARELVESGEIVNIGNPAKTWLGVPLLANGKAIGAIVLQDYNNEDIYTERDKTFMELVSIQITNAIIRTRDQQKLKLLGRAIEQSPVTVVITDKNGNIEYANPMFSRTTGYTINEVLGYNPRILKSGTHSIEFYQNLWNTIHSGGDWYGEFKNRKKNGELYWESCVISPIYGNDGEIQSFIAVKEDITDKKLMIDEIIEAKEKAEESDQLKSAFLANMSHEIRTPLNSIIGFSELFVDPYFDHEQHIEFAKIIQENSNSLLNIISDIMDFSKIEAGQIRIKRIHFSANELLNTLVKEYSPKAVEKNICLRIDPAILMEEISVENDNNRVKQVMVNFVSNALKFTEVGFINIGLRKENDNIKFYVSDTGIGIEQEHHYLIFERFRQVEKANTRRYGGNGLGLAISKNLIELMGGEIGVESERGKGSTFYFTLPFYDPPEEKIIL